MTYPCDVLAADGNATVVGLICPVSAVCVTPIVVKRAVTTSLTHASKVALVVCEHGPETDAVVMVMPSVK
jgi:hypothetical protein